MSRFENLEFGSEKQHVQEQVCTGNANSFMRQAQEAFEAGHFEQALRIYSRVLQFDPKLALAWSGQVRMLIELGEFDEARVWADKALGSFPDDAELLAAKAVALARSGDLQGAISYSDAAVESQTNTPYIWLARGDVLLARREKRAEFCFDKALALAGGNWFVHWLSARIHAFYSQFARALKLVQQALALEPARAVLWLETGRCQLALGLTTQAGNSFAQARELDPEMDTRALTQMAAESTFIQKLAGRWRHWFPK